MRKSLIISIIVFAVSCNIILAIYCIYLKKNNDCQVKMLDLLRIQSQNAIVSRIRMGEKEFIEQMDKRHIPKTAYALGAVYKIKLLLPNNNDQVIADYLKLIEPPPENSEDYFFRDIYIEKFSSKK